MTIEIKIKGGKEEKAQGYTDCDLAAQVHEIFTGNEDYVNSGLLLNNDDGVLIIAVTEDCKDPDTVKDLIMTAMEKLLILNSSTAVSKRLAMKNEQIQEMKKNDM